MLFRMALESSRLTVGLARAGCATENETELDDLLQIWELAELVSSSAFDSLSTNTKAALYCVGKSTMHI